MPTIKRIEPYRFFFFSNEGSDQAHVYVQHENRLAKFWLEPVGPSWSNRFPASELTKIRELVLENQRFFLPAWYELFAPRR
ncbi:MAG: DUF4160 domain-containing protein [Acidobacteria bacterium]|nr:DUF4160 domain-containing protein [Acidobacteriota bacterium]MCG3192597.1 hypothetical protein [Thermoanaerobaculia bacterium]MCK6685874.1 DUF4160 domain-containing protein [Thermoanaerobaculia bacterium]